MARGRKLTDLTGQRFNTFTVTQHLGRKTGGTRYLCICDCGERKEYYAQHLKAGNTKCRCQLIYDHPLHGIWRNMIDRCVNPNCDVYHNYGGRGISVCDRWKHSFRDFLADMGPRPKGTSLDRINNDGDYGPDNCKWSTILEQNSNKRTNVHLTYRGETKTMAEWARTLGISREAMRTRIARGLSDNLLFHRGRM